MWPFSKKQEPVQRKHRPQKNLRMLTNDSSIITEEISRLMPNSAAGMYNPNQVFNSEAKSIRHRCRKLCMTSDLATRYIEMDVDNVIGEGITLKIPANVLSTEQYEHFTRAWNKFTCTKNFGVRKQFNFNTFQREVERFRAVDGESFVVLVETNDEAGFRVDIIDAERVGAHLQPNGADVGPLVIENGEYLRYGIFFDTYGRITKYRVSRDVRTPSDTFDVPSDHCLHLFNRKFPDQIRGISDIMPVIDSIGHHEAYLNAELIAKKISAQAMGFITQNPNTQLSDNEFVEDGSPLAIEETFEAGVFKELPPGYDIKSFSGGTQPAELQAMTKEVVSSVARGLNVFYNSLAGDLSSINYSSARYGALEERKMWRTRQNAMCDVILDPIFEMFVKKYAKRNGLDETLVEDLLLTRIWICPKWASVDPQKEADYYEKMIANGLKTRHDIIVEDGGDPEYVIPAWFAEQKKFIEASQPEVEKDDPVPAEKPEVTTEEETNTEEVKPVNKDDE